jgi:hypothetical protein
MSTRLKYISALAISWMLTGCSKGGDAPATSVAPEDSGAAAASCELKPGDGGTSAISLLSGRHLQRAAFGKEYNRSKLDGILTASEVETLSYVQADGVSVFKKENDGKGCSLHSGAAVMPSKVNEYWESLHAQLEKNEKEKVRIMGLYAGKTSAILAATDQAGPFIVIRENSTRWTLVHEYMHHLFMSEAVARGHDDQAVHEHLDTAFQRLIGITSDDIQTEYGLIDAVSAFVEYAKYNDEVLLHFYLEEMAVEDQLRSDFESGKLKFVTYFDYQNAGWYIGYSADNFSGLEDQVQKFSTTLEEKIKTSDISSNRKTSLLSRVSAVSKQVQLRKKQVSDLKSKLGGVAAPAAPAGVAMISWVYFHAPCSHAYDLRKSTIALKKFNQKFKGAL